METVSTLGSFQLGAALGASKQAFTQQFVVVVFAAR